ncbi:uncharacterized protein LOC118503622 [Anopheles stephensi]|uniref:uncharacterized protein LOC118503622 n=1 Tax=Anopheles stephensi TaxID=30069 RepID=UPI001658BB54|nr:uncharacterized protein LOC118503622 [Anopheles stephensi]
MTLSLRTLIIRRMGRSSNSTMVSRCTRVRVSPWQECATSLSLAHADGTNEALDKGLRATTSDSCSSEHHHCTRVAGAQPRESRLCSVWCTVGLVNKARVWKHQICTGNDQQFERIEIGTPAQDVGERSSKLQVKHAVGTTHLHTCAYVKQTKTLFYSLQRLAIQKKKQKPCLGLNRLWRWLVVAYST